MTTHIERRDLCSATSASVISRRSAGGTPVPPDLNVSRGAAGEDPAPATWLEMARSRVLLRDRAIVVDLGPELCLSLDHKLAEQPASRGDVARRQPPHTRRGQLRSWHRDQQLHARAPSCMTQISDLNPCFLK